MTSIKQWWLVSYGDARGRSWVFESEVDAFAFADQTGGKAEPVPASLAARPCEHPLPARATLIPPPNYIYSCGKCHSIVYGQ